MQETIAHPTLRHPMDLSGKVAIVTGGNRGIGLGIARGLATAGCGVAIWGRSPEQNRKAEEACAGQPGKVAAFACDVLDDDAVRHALSGTLERFGRVDGLFANAGIGGGGRTPFVEQTTEDWRRMLELNLLGAQRVARAVVECMVRQVRKGAATGGRIVLTSSVAARVGTAFNQHYAASKAGLVAMARGLAVELGRHRITANALLPGYFQTEMIGDLLENEKFNERVLPRLAIRRYGDPAELGGIAIYLMSDASAYHTGDAITIDGGFAVT
jgi:NAD(P)-dependent dehydrogenase (short-subunit alcohol dehydrogenase family)